MPFLTAAAAVACTTGTPAPSPTTSPVAPSALPSNPTGSTGPAGPAGSVGTAATTAGRRAVDAYLGMWQSMAADARTSNWRSVLLGEYATGAALTTITRGLYADHQNSLVTRGAPANSPSVTAVEPADRPDRVTITDCGDSTQWLKYHAGTGEPAEDGPGGRRAISAVVDRQSSGGWKVSDFAVRAVGTC